MPTGRNGEYTIGHGVLTNETTADVELPGWATPSLAGLDGTGREVVVLTLGEYDYARNDGTPRPDRFVLKPGQSMGFTNREFTNPQERQVVSWFPKMTNIAALAQWADYPTYGRCLTPGTPASRPVGP